MRKFLLAVGWITVFLLAAIGVFAVSIALSSVWVYVWAIWLLLGITGWLIQFLPKFRGMGVLIWMALLYGCGFVLLWLESSDRVSMTNSAEQIFVAFSIALPGVIALSGAGLVLTWVRTPAKLRKGLSWLGIALLFGLLVAFFSGNTGAVDPMLAFFSSLGLSEGAAQAVVFVLRKSIHFLFYGTFGWAAYKAGYLGGCNKAGAVVFSAGLVLSHAAFDEFRQASLTRRTGTPWDFALDAAGVATFVALSARSFCPLPESKSA